MNKETHQILRNQMTIMRFLRFGFQEIKADGILGEGLVKRLEETDEILNPKEEPTVPEKTEKSINRVIKAGEDCPRCGVIGVCAEKLEHHNSGRCIPKSKVGKREK